MVQDTSAVISVNFHNESSGSFQLMTSNRFWESIKFTTVLVDANGSLYKIENNNIATNDHYMEPVKLESGQALAMRIFVKDFRLKKGNYRAKVVYRSTSETCT